MNFYQKTFTTEEVRDAVIRHILREYQNAGLIKTDAEYDRLRIKFEAELSSGNLISQNIDVTGRAKAEDYNKIFYNLYIDMLTTFEKMNIAGDKLEEHKRLHQSIIANNNIRLDILSDEIKRLEERLFNASDDYTYLERFRTADSFETDSTLYADERGAVMPSYAFVSYNKYGEFIALTRSAVINKITHFNGTKMADIRINKQLGSGLITIKNPLNKLHKAIDTSMKSYWEETVMAEEPFKIELGREYWFNKFGALCEIEIIFSSIVDINEIALLPFGAYPLEVVAIKRYLSDDPNWEEETYNYDYAINGSKVIVSPNNKIKILKSSISKEYIIYQFRTIKAKRLRIILNQRHYVRVSAVIEKSDAEKTELWFNETDSLNLKLKVKQVGSYEDKGLLEKLWLVMTQKVWKLDIKAIKDMLFSRFQEKIPITRFEYNYGLYNVACNEVDYSNKSIYVSKPIRLNKNIASIWLTVIETVPSDITTCDIKYFITAILKPTGFDWIPIVPSNRKGFAGYEKEIDFKERLRNKLIDPFISKETFISNKTRSLKLNHLPFIIYNSPGWESYFVNDPSKLYDVYFKLVISDKNGRAQSVEDVTDVFNQGSSNQHFNDLSIYQYYFYENRVFFNQKIPNGFKIEIVYRHFVDTIRVKAIFTKGSNTTSVADEVIGITPTLSQYKLHYRILE